MSEVRQFKLMGKNLILICNMLLQDQDLCKLLLYTTKNPLSEPTIVDTDSLMNKNIRVIPKMPDEASEKGSFVTVLLDEFVVDEDNEQVKAITIRFDVICPLDEWVLNTDSLRPFLIMNQIQEKFQGARLNGIGTLKFIGADRVSFSDYYGGYSMVFTNHGFN